MSVSGLIKIAALVLLLFALSVTAAGGSQAADDPNPVIGATYVFSAVTGAATARGKGQLDLDGRFKATVRGSSRKGGEPFAVVGRVTKFVLTFLLPRKRLALTIEVTQGPPECPKGTHGTVILVDDDAGDSVRMRFRRASCSPLERSWSTAVSGQHVDVSILVVEESSEPSSNVPRVVLREGETPPRAA